jgi:hypothetical protein
MCDMCVYTTKCSHACTHMLRLLLLCSCQCAPYVCTYTYLWLSIMSQSHTLQEEGVQQQVANGRHLADAYICNDNSKYSNNNSSSSDSSNSHESNGGNDRRRLKSGDTDTERYRSNPKDDAVRTYFIHVQDCTHVAHVAHHTSAPSECSQWS